jgi:hypothetical protein
MGAMTEDKRGKRLRLEVVVASPPTQKCRAIEAVMKEMTRRFPDMVRLDVYVLGQRVPVMPTRSYLHQGKIRRVPSAYVNGHLVAKQVVPDPMTVESRIREELAKGPEGWQS